MPGKEQPKCRRYKLPTPVTPNCPHRALKQSGTILNLFSQFCPNHCLTGNKPNRDNGRVVIHHCQSILGSTRCCGKGPITSVCNKSLTRVDVGFPTDVKGRRCCLPSAHGSHTLPLLPYSSSWAGVSRIPQLILYAAALPCAQLPDGQGEHATNSESQ